MPAQIDFHKKCITPSQIDFLHKMPKLDVDDSYIKNFVNDLLYAFNSLRLHCCTLQFICLAGSKYP